ncbi:MAG: GNAT family N-acetyltransferase [Burkholderiales bacterium]
MAATTFRRGAAADAAALAEFAARTFAETFGADNRPEDMCAHLAKSYGIAQQTAELDDRDVVTLLAHRADALVAYAQVRRQAPPPCVTHERPIQLHRFYVDRPAHGSGIAAQLMAEARAVARALGGRHLWLTVWERNPRAIAFYGKMGFSDVGTADYHLGPERQTDRVLVIRLDP